tara:strand:- start:66 stop:608 length:543 start_codon:yes stop_codon:yes gene_type:complete
MLHSELQRPGSPSSDFCVQSLKKFGSYKEYDTFVENGIIRLKYFCEDCSFNENIRGVTGIEPANNDILPFTIRLCDHCRCKKQCIFYKKYTLHKRTMSKIFQKAYSYYHLYNDENRSKYVMIQKIWRGYRIRKKKAKNTTILTVNNYLLSENLHEYESYKECFEIYDSTECELDLLSKTP